MIDLCISNPGNFIFLALVVISILLKINTLSRKHVCIWTKRDLNLIQKLFFVGISEFAKFWNSYEIHFPHFNSINSSIFPENTLLVGYHSRPTIDLLYLCMALQPKMVVHYLVFRIPLARDIIISLGGISSGENERGDEIFVDELLKDTRPILLLPGGVFELTKKYEEIHQVQWKSKPGFARVISESEICKSKKICIIPFYTKNCEKGYWSMKWWYNYSGKLIRHLIPKLKDGEVWVLPILNTFNFFSLGFMILPNPIKMDTYFGDPVYYQPGEPAETLASRVKKSLQNLIVKTESLPTGANLKPESHKHPLKSICIGVVAVFQNTLSVMLLVSSIWIFSPILIILHYTSLYVKRKFTKKLSKIS